MDSQAPMKLMKLFNETPQAQEIYATLRRQQKEAERANNESPLIDIPDQPDSLVQPVEKFVKLFIEQAKELDASPDEGGHNVLTMPETFDEPSCTCDDEPTTSATLFSESDSKFSQDFQNVDLQKQRELMKWSLKIVKDKSIIVEGQRSGDPSDMSWRTSVICGRISTNAVKSIKGTLYFLLGEIDENNMIGKGFSKDIINMFRYGFPPNWRDVFAKTIPEQLESWEHEVESETAVRAADGRRNMSLKEEANVAHSTLNDKPTEQSVMPPNPRARPSKRDAAKKDTSKKKKASSEPRRPKEKNKKTKPLLSNTTATDDGKEIEVKRTRSGRLICPVLNYWTGQRITISPDREGEISIIKSNLEEDLRLTLVETSKNSGVVLQNPTVSSSGGTTTTSETEWTAGSTTASGSKARNLKRQNNVKKVTNTNSLRAKSQSDEAIFTASDTDHAIEHEKPKNNSRTKSAKQTKTTSISRKRKQNHEISESEQEISKRPGRQKSESITKTSTSQNKNKINLTETQKTSTRIIDEMSGSEQLDVEQVQHNNLKTKSTAEIARTYPRRTRIRFEPFQVKGSEKKTQRQVYDPENVVKQDKSTNSSRSAKLVKPSVKESQTQPSKKLKVETGKLTSRTGTLARKRELRDMLEQQDEGYEDDAFEGTPFRNQKLSRTHKISPVDIGDSEDFPEEINDEDYKTPSSKTPMNRLRPAGPLSIGKSENDVMTPGLLNNVNRNDLDRYVNQLRRQNLRNIRKKVESHIPLAKKPSSGIPGGVDYSFNIQTKSTAMDDEESEDYYWSDNE